MNYNSFNIEVTFKKEILSTLESTVTQKEQILKVKQSVLRMQWTHWTWFLWGSRLHCGPVALTYGTFNLCPISSWWASSSSASSERNGFISWVHKCIWKEIRSCTPKSCDVNQSAENGDNWERKLKSTHRWSELKF